MPSIGFQSANRRIKDARILAFALLSRDFQNMRAFDCKFISLLRGEKGSLRRTVTAVELIVAQ